MLHSFPFITPCVPSRRNEPPKGAGWLHEAKLDGWRGQFHIYRGGARLYSKRGNDLDFRFPDMVRSVSRLSIGDVILDGEITALDGQGLPNFDTLQRADGGRESLPRYAGCVRREFETNLRQERQLEGIAKGKAEGIYAKNGGRKATLDADKVKSASRLGHGSSCDRETA